LFLPPQVDLTTNGKAMIKNFLFDISGCTGNYSLQGREVECLKYIKETVGSNRVLVRERYFTFFSRINCFS
jgi:GMP synthase (glutamine-hydrolysing)